MNVVGARSRICVLRVAFYDFAGNYITAAIHIIIHFDWNDKLVGRYLVLKNTYPFDCFN